MEQTTEQSHQPKTSSRRGVIIAVAIAFIVIVGTGGLVYWKISSGYVYTDTATITAPTIALSPTTGGILQALYVNTGDVVPANTPVARVGNEVITTQTQSLVVSVQNNIGGNFNPGDAVVTVIDPSTLRIDGQVEDDKGLSDIAIGDKVNFTVDGFKKTYQGVVDEISPTSHQDDVVFNISDQREVSSFDVKARFDVDEYPELKNGMSAKMTIYKQ
jgi:multidrug resistance efflux pump